MPIISEREFLRREFDLISSKNNSIYSLDAENIDVTIYNTKHQVMCWIEGKKDETDVYSMLSQLIFTAYKIKNKDVSNFPPYFGCYDGVKGALVSSLNARQVFEFNDINWAQTPSNLDSKTITTIKQIIEPYTTIYQREEFLQRIKLLHENREIQRTNITRSNFNVVYQEWYIHIGQLLDLSNFDEGTKILPDCYLADLMHDGTKTVADNLTLVLHNVDGELQYVDKKKSLAKTVKIKDIKRYKNFWKRYNRPPSEEYREYILSRRDLLQPSNIREIKGAFFTPTIWSFKSKEYLAKALGDDWQDKYYIWDCCCGTGNLCNGLYNQDRVFMSTIDQQDIDTMIQNKILQDAIKFQFDFLNDDWKPISDGGKLPDKLYNIINNEPEKLVIYINPPYVEATNLRMASGSGEHRTGVAVNSLKKEINSVWGAASNEIVAHFYYQIKKHINGCKIGCFSTIKNITGANFAKYRKNFKKTFLCGCMFPANTFDNVKGKFPISFQIWDTSKKQDFPKEVEMDVYTMIGNNENGIYNYEGIKKVINYDNDELINAWFENNNKSTEEVLGGILKIGNDFSHNNYIWIYAPEQCKSTTHNNNNITKSNIINALIYYSVRTSFPNTWLNDRDQFTRPFFTEQPDPNNPLQTIKHYNYEDDNIFISNCIIYALFTKNYTTWQLFSCSELDISNDGTRNQDVWNIITNYIDKNWENSDKVSLEGRNVLHSARELYIFYHHNTVSPKLTASWNDVIDTIKGKKIDSKGNIGRRNSSCVDYPDAQEIMDNLSKNLYDLSLKIQDDVYKYGFLRGEN